MFSSQVTFSRVTRQQVVGQLKSTNSIDPDVLFAAKEALIAPVKPLKIIGLWASVTGGLMTLTIFLAVLGVPLVSRPVYRRCVLAEMWQTQQRASQNIK